MSVCASRRNQIETRDLKILRWLFERHKIHFEDQKIFQNHFGLSCSVHCTDYRYGKHYREYERNKQQYIRHLRTNTQYTVRNPHSLCFRFTLGESATLNLLKYLLNIFCWLRMVITGNGQWLCTAFHDGISLGAQHFQHFHFSKVFHEI